MDKHRTKANLIWIVGIILGGVVLLVIIFLNPFHKEKKMSRHIFDTSEYIELDDFIVDNSSSIDELLTTEYSLEELETFFGKYSSIGRGIIESFEEYKSLSWDDVKFKFPVECLRRHGNSYYSIYRVKEGGLFYVFWMVPLKSTPSEVLDQICPIRVRFSIHLNSLASIKDFQPIKKLSTAADVMQIDAQMEFNFFLSSGVCSYNLLDNGKVLEIRYHYDKLEELSDLIIDECKIMSKKDSMAAISCIDDSDLP